jgi:predicted DNA-binding transcriptional regulator AlpA
MQSNDERPRRLLPDPQVWKRYGVTAMTLYRWDHNPALNFPKPVVIGRRKYRDEAELELWERSLPTKTPAAKKSEAA